MPNPDLRLHEQVLLLALRDEKGTVESKAGMYRLALGGALLAELVLEDCIRVGEDKKVLVDFVRMGSFDDDVLDECQALVRSAKRRRRAASWVSSFGNIKRLRRRVAVQLQRRGILREAEDQVLLIFKRKVYPTIDPEPERELVQRMTLAIDGDQQEVEPRLAILIALAHSTGLIRVHVDRDQLKRRKSRLEQIAQGQVIGGATQAAVQAAQAAAMAAITAATVATTVTTAGR